MPPLDIPPRPTCTSATPATWNALPDLPARRTCHLPRLKLSSNTTSWARSPQDLIQTSLPHHIIKTNFHVYFPYQTNELVSKFPCIPELRQEFKTKQEFSEQMTMWVNVQWGQNPTPGHSVVGTVIKKGHWSQRPRLKHPGLANTCCEFESHLASKSVSYVRWRW